MKKTVLVAAALAIVTCAAPVWSQGRPASGGPGGMGGFIMACPVMAIMPPQAAMIDRITESLQLTDDQSSKLKEILTKGGETVSALQKKSAEASKALREAVTAADFDAENVKTLADKAEKAEAAVISASIDEWVQIRALLTADQAKSLQEMMSKRQGSGQKPAGPPPGADGFTPPPAPEQ